MEHYDLAVVGAGIVGLGHALAAIDRGLRVVVIDASAGMTNASVRNFGHLAISAHADEAEEHARRSREIWLDLAGRVGFWLRRTGTLLVATHESEMALLSEAGEGRLLSSKEVQSIAPVVGSVGGMVRDQDLQVDPREAAAAIAAWLTSEGVEFRWRTAATGAEPGMLHTTRGPVRAGAIVIAVNHDIDRLFPDIADQYRVERCGLDMLLADGVGLRIPVLTGSSMLRYSAFASLPSAPDVRARFRLVEPEILDLDVNQMYTERPDGTLIVGDTHSVGANVTPFQDERAYALLERLGARLFGRPMRVRQRWQGIYAKAPRDFLRVSPCEGVRVVSVTTGIGMTTGLGLAASVIDELFGSLHREALR